MEFLVYIFVFITSFLVFTLLGQFIFFRKQIVINRMDLIKLMFTTNDDEDEMKKPFAERVINPVYDRIITAIGNITPTSIKQKYEKLIIQAGVGKKFSVDNVLAIQVMLAIVLGGGMYTLYTYTNRPVNYMFIIFFVLLGFFYPFLKLNSTADIRQKSIQKSLPDLLDLLYISVEAGLGFDLALKKSSEKMPGPLSDEIIKALEDISKGRERQEALKGIVKRTGVDDLNTFVTAVIQSEQLGTNISSMLRIQSNVMRQKRRQRAEEAAMKIPVKMLFPLIFLMFPAIFVVLLGPAIINIMESLGDFL